MRPAYGPTLPRLLRERLGVPERLTAVLGAAAAVLLVLGGGLAARGDETAIEREAPAPFLVEYPHEVLRPRPLRAGELVRLEARRGAFVVAFTVRPLPGGRPASPVELQGLAARRVERLRSSLPGFRLREERGARPYGAPGYQLGWRSRDVVARELFAVPEEDRRSAGVLLALHRSRVRGGLDAAQQRLFDAGRRTWFSFRFTR